ncbi:MAG: prolyl oligopeptidase family serine peptidase [Chloroflexota bacterium]
MISPAIAPYGTWQSPITADLILAGSVGLGQIALDGVAVYWTEHRPQEKGRSVVVRWTEAGGREDVTPAPYNARTRAHEYGGGEFAVYDGIVYFSHFVDNRLYRQIPGAMPEAITPEDDLYYADFILDRTRKRLIGVREDHRPADREVINTLVAIPLGGLMPGEQTKLVEGNDFYASPRLSPDGRWLAWLTWNHPNMPWDGTELWVAEVTLGGRLTNHRLVAGGTRESIFQPEWSPPDASGNSRLHFISDRTGWWNLYRLRDGQVEALFPMAAEFGMPQWVFGLSTYDFESPTRIVCAYTQNGRPVMARLDTATGILSTLDLPYQLLFPSYGQLAVADGYLVYSGASPTLAPAIIRVDLETLEWSVLRRSTELEIDSGYLSVAQAIEFPTTDGLTAYGYYYSPHNRDFMAPEGERPPLIVTSHGGPTSGTNDFLSLSRQYWTSRGFAILDVNYGGSTGFGRPYRERLYGSWGIVDVDDCANGARYLVEQGLADGERLIIRGGSAGGYTTLCAVTFHNVFKAAASHYGVSDAEALAKDTHKFESRYLDQLIGPYPARRDVYVERSPIHVAHQCSSALILFQGLDDKVVSPNQSEAMFLAARAKELPVAYVTFEGEGHGFRQAQNIKRAIEAELYFYSRVFDFELAEPVEPVEIENLP